MQLRDRLSKATGPDRRIDAEIAVAMRIPPRKTQPWIERWERRAARDDGHVALLHHDDRESVHWESDLYTASIDAAVTLVPDGVQWECVAGGNDKPAYVAFSLDGDIYLNDADGATPALALCIARIGYELGNMPDGPDEIEEQGRGAAEHAPKSPGERR